MENIQQPTSNIEHPLSFGLRTYWVLDVGCWMLDVECFIPLSV